ncbi:MAG: GAF domain-containing protein [Leptolyngbyaceae cyanobacterium SM2_5_2]|nr:GAF domain-containing protein [Leptolyngbyaceae cyanobacterium SM2_5_2]
MDISLFRSIAGQYDNLRRTQSVDMMNVISHQIEDQIIHHQLPVDFYAGFQRFSHFPDQLRRYSRLGAICRRVYVLGIADYQPPSIQGIEFIELAPTSALTREWFLLVDTPDFWATLVAQEIERNRSFSKGERQFDCFWSYDEVVVDRISLLMSQIMETLYKPVQQRHYGNQNNHITEINSRMLANIEQSEQISQRRWCLLQVLHEATEIVATSPAQLVNHIAAILHSIFGADGVLVAFKSNDGCYGIPATAGDANGKDWKMPLTKGISGYAIQQARVVHIQDTNQWQDSEALMPSARSLLAAPIVGRRVYGAIAVGATKVNHWNTEDSKTLVAVAKIVASYIDQILLRTAHKNGQPTTGVPIVMG